MAEHSKLASMVRGGLLGSGMAEKSINSAQIANEYKKYVIEEHTEGRLPIPQSEFAKLRGYL